jgi:hypothetical protein
LPNFAVCLGSLFVELTGCGVGRARQKGGGRASPAFNPVLGRPAEGRQNVLRKSAAEDSALLSAQWKGYSLKATAPPSKKRASVI